MALSDLLWSCMAFYGLLWQNIGVIDPNSFGLVYSRKNDLCVFPSKILEAVTIRLSVSCYYQRNGGVRWCVRMREHFLSAYMSASALSYVRECAQVVQSTIRSIILDEALCNVE